MSPAREYAVFEIAPGGRADFEALQGRMGLPLCGSDSTEADDRWWFTASSPDGSMRRAFGFRSQDRIELGGLIGVVGTTPMVRFSVGYVDITDFQAEGPGAQGRIRKHPPMLRPDQIKALYQATGRRYAR